MDLSKLSDEELLGMLKQSAPRANPVINTDAKAGADMAASDVGPGEALMISAGRTTDKVLSGMKQLGLTAIQKIAPQSFSDAAASELDKLKATEGQNDQAYAALQAKRPVATAIGGALPYMAIPASAGIPTAAAGAAAIGAAQYGTPQERLARGAIDATGTVAGGLLGRLAGKAIAPVTPEAMTESKQAALEAAREIGVRPRLSEVTGSPFAARLEDFAARVPGGAGVMAKFTGENQRAVNKAAASAIGQNADELTPKVFSDASTKLGQVFEDIKSLGKVQLNGRTVNPIALDSGVSQAADEILKSQAKAAPEFRNAAITSLAERAKQMAGMKGRIDGEAYQTIRSDLTSASFDATGSDKRLFGKLLEAIDTSADRSLRQLGRPDLADALKVVRPQYSALKTLEKGAVAEGGNVSPARVASALRTANPGAFREGRMSGPLYDIATIGENMKPLQAGSPTFERSIVSSPLATTITAPFAWAAAHLTTSPAALLYPSLVGGSKAAQAGGILGDSLTRASTMGLLNAPLARSMGLLPVPIMAEQ